MERLPALTAMNEGPSCQPGGRAKSRKSSPTPGRSTLITSAPRSCSWYVQKGPASACVRSRTQMPSSASMHRRELVHEHQNLLDETFWRFAGEAMAVVLVQHQL